MSMTGVLRPGHVQLRVLDLDEAVTHYREYMGLIETHRDAQGRVYLKGWDEQDWFSVVLREADDAGMDHMAFKVLDEETLWRLQADIKKFGCKIERIAAGELDHCGERVRFQAPTGHMFELYANKDHYGNGIPTINPAPWPEGLKGMKAVRFDHCLVYGEDLEGSVKLFTEVLGFQLTEQIVDGDLQLAAFMTCSTKAHDVAFIRQEGKAKLHHASFLLKTWEDVLRAGDIISMKDISIDMGPTRHGLTRGQTIYFFDPSGNRNEVFSDDSYVYPDTPVLTWTADRTGQAIFYHSRELNERFMGVTTGA